MLAARKPTKITHGILYGCPDGLPQDYTLTLRPSELAKAVSKDGREYVIMCRGCEIFLEPVNTVAPVSLPIHKRD